MPVICRWGNVRIVMWSREDDRHSPHFHVRCAGLSASISIADGQVYASNLSAKDLRDVLAWAARHRAELRSAWDAIEAGLEPDQIEP